MTRVALKGLLGRKVRAFLTALAIVLGVAMVSGSFVLTDTISKAFTSIFSSAYDHTDAIVSGKKLVDYSSSGNAMVSPALLEQIRKQPYVEAAAPAIAGEKPDPAWLEELLDAVGIADRRRHRPAELSGGQQQRVAVARALITRPKVLFADEPTGNLDSASSREVLCLLRRAVDDWGQTIVMVTHDAGAAAMADRILFLADGRIVRDVEESTAAEVIAAMQEVSSR